MISEEKQKLLEQVVDCDMDFFTSMKTEDPIPENTLPALRRMRWMTYSVLSEKTLRLWLRDLRQAKADGRNTMIEKYALIENQIPTIQENPVIGQIATQEEKWMGEVAEKYPRTVQGHDDNRSLFKRYMMCELQSWSPEALDSYWADIQKALDEGWNMAEKRYDYLYLSLGKGTLKELNDELEQKVGL